MVFDMLNKNVHLIMFLLFFACSNSSNSNKIKTDNCYSITTDEFISFWNKFSDALLTNNSSALDSLIDDNFYGCYNNFLTLGYHSFNISEIVNMDFSVDTVISKPRFLKEFRNSLNPVYLQLLEQYDVQEDIKPKMYIKTVEDFQNSYRCMQTIEKKDYLIGNDFRDAHLSSKVNFIIRCTINNDNFYDEVRQLDLIFNKINDKIKLCEIDFSYSWIADYPLETK